MAITGVTVSYLAKRAVSGRAPEAVDTNSVTRKYF